MPKYFKITQKEIDYLSGADKKLGKLIERVGILKREIDTDPFTSLVGGIISQQISTKAAASIYAKFEKLVKSITPKNILRASLEDLRLAGLSGRKVDYIVGIAKAVESGELDFQKLKKLTEEEVIKELVKLKGIGIWSAEMFLIFTLERRDFLSYLDLGIRRGLMRLHKLESLDKVTFLKYQKRYSPYGTVASLYLWHLASE